MNITITDTSIALYDDGKLFPFWRNRFFRIFIRTLRKDLIYPPTTQQPKLSGHIARLIWNF